MNKKNSNRVIEIEPDQLEFSTKNNKVGLTITNNSTGPLDLELRINSDCKEKFKIPSLRGDDIICKNNKSGSVMVNPNEHQYLVVYYESPNNEIQKSSDAKLELEYRDQQGQRKTLAVPLIILNK